VHIILDEHAGVESLPEGSPRTGALAKSLKSFYISRDFRLFGRAYSEYPYSFVSIPNILSFGTLSAGEVTDSNHSQYFDALKRRGYVIDVVQTNYIDYCRKNLVKSCVTYHWSNFWIVHRSAISAAAKARLLLLAYSRVGRFYRALRVRNVPLPELNFDLEGVTLPLIVPTAARLVHDQLRRAQPGHAYFAHLLLPHFPSARRSDCTLKPVGAWERNDMGSMTQRREAYLDQLECTQKVIAANYATVSAATGGNFIMIIHGDHGSRLVNRRADLRTMNSYSDRDMISAFGTLFAVRGPSIPGGYDRTVCSGSALMAAVARAELVDDGTFRPRCPAPVVRFGSHPNWERVRSKTLPKSWTGG
jgi:hypothetical protein